MLCVCVCVCVWAPPWFLSLSQPSLPTNSAPCPPPPPSSTPPAKRARIAPAAALSPAGKSGPSPVVTRARARRSLAVRVAAASRVPAP